MSTDEDFYSTKSYDKDLRRLPGLRWLPWVGRYYETTKFLVVGRNHHQWDGYNPDEECEFTRRVVRKQGICGHDTTPFIRNVERILCGDDSAMWSAVAFHNLMLRSHPPSEKNFPNPSDWSDGTCILHKLLCVLKPRFCLFCFASKKEIRHHFSDYNVENRVRIGTVAPVVGRSSTHDTTVTFVREPSKANVRDWRKFLLNDPCCQPHIKLMNDTARLR